MKIVLIGIVGLLMLAACGNGKQREIDDLADEVMLLHDEVMPITEDLYRARRDIQKSLKTDSTDKEKRLAIILELKSAEDAMMDWMHNFELDYVGETHEETFDYFSAQKQSIEEVGTQMRYALNKGKSTLESLESDK